MQRAGNLAVHLARYATVPVPVPLGGLLIYAGGVSNKELVIVHTYCGSRRIGYKSRASQVVITCEGSAPMGRHHLGQVKD